MSSVVGLNSSSFLLTKDKTLKENVGLLPLHFIAANRHPRLENVQTLMDIFPAASEAEDKKGWLPLHWCAFNCSSVEVFDLVYHTYPKAIYRPTLKGQLPFQLSLCNHRLDMINAVYDANRDALEGMDYRGNSAAHDAAKSLNAEGIKRLIELSPNSILLKNFRGEFPLHLVFQHIPDSPRLRWRQLETVRALLDSGPEVTSMMDKDGNLPLHLATYYNTSIDVIDALYQVYPSAAIVKDSDGKLPVHYARTADIQRLLLKASPPLLKVGLKDSFSKFSFPS